MTTDPVTVAPGGPGGADTGLEFVRPPAVALPRGGGAIRGIGEKFSVETATGTAALAIPISTSSGRAGFGPKLNLGYDSGSGNGPFGFGWSLHLPAITRKTDKGLPRYDDAGESDVFMLSGTDDLVPVLDPDTGEYADDRSRPGYVVRRYRPRIEGLFARIERWTHVMSGDVHWRSTSHDNITTVYGASASSRVTDPERAAPRLQLAHLRDLRRQGQLRRLRLHRRRRRGVDVNRSSERTRSRTANRYPRTIRYGNREPLDRSGSVLASDLEPSAWFFEVLFDYDEELVVEVPPDPTIDPDAQLARVEVREPSSNASWAARPDPFSSYRSGFEVRTHRRCRRVLMFHRFAELGDGLVPGAFHGLRLRGLRSHSGDGRRTSPGRPGRARPSGQLGVRKLPAVGGAVGLRPRRQRRPGRGQGRAGHVCSSVDTTRGAGVQPTGVRRPRCTTSGATAWTACPRAWTALDTSWSISTGKGCPASWPTRPTHGCTSRTWARPGSERCARSAGSRRRSPDMEPCSSSTSGQTASSTSYILDSDGAGFYERDDDGGWHASGPSLCPMQPGDPNLRFVDLDGDGLADVSSPRTTRSRGTRRWGSTDSGRRARCPTARDEERGMRLVFADGTQTIYPRRHGWRRPDRPGPDPQRRGLLLAEPAATAGSAPR